ncbi:squalene synthase HpnC [Caldimonas brevitalea]|uniref:Phytoene synthase n=1 Tax=Caldimonas brevitalea TaxID=413882 RepID=A0A0G3BGF5_9BURK|nr:squalene synthase HpnC [Caldimonas brevitalea]AKJ28514.1 phytoene synthase [Caldimonas brevitalea]
MSVNHYENFPVASALCPPRLRPAVKAIYWYARTADDLADEGPQNAAQRLADLAAYRGELLATCNGLAPGARWRAVFEPLQHAQREFGLPVELLEDLLSAFEQDVVKHRYLSREELLDYCRRSANPVGRLLLHLCDVHDETSQAQSDAICTALQLINFWQDLSIDTARDRLYIPLDACREHQVPVGALMAQQETPGTRGLVRALVQWARELMLSGAPLTRRLPGRMGWELRLVVQGGLRILEKIERLDYDTLHQRPVLSARDAPTLLWRAWRHTPAASPATTPSPVSAPVSDSAPAPAASDDHPT